MNNDSQTPQDSPPAGERRALPRDATLRPAQLATPGSVLDGLVVDISPNGLQVRCKTPLTPGARVEVEVHPRKEEDGSLVYLVRGVVVRCEPEGGAFALGIRLATHLGETEDLHGFSFSDPVAAAAAVQDVTALLRRLHGESASPLAYAAHRASEPVGEAPPRRRWRRVLALLLLPLLFLALLLWRAQRDPEVPRDAPWPGAASHSATTQPASLLIDALLAAVEAKKPDDVRSALAALRTHAGLTATQRLIAALGAATLPGEARPGLILEALPGAAPEWQGVAESFLRGEPGQTEAAPAPLGDLQTVAWFDEAASPSAPSPIEDARVSDTADPSAGPLRESNGLASPRGGLGGPLLPLAASGDEPESTPAHDAEPGQRASAPPQQAPKPSSTPPQQTDPGAPIRVEVDTDTFVLTVFRDGEPVQRFPVGLGRDASTPTGQFRIANKLVNPAWYNGGTVVPPGDPDNAIGAYWMGLGRDGKATRYGIHPTNDPAAIGAEKSRGCIRMRPADAAALFELLPLGASVTIH